MSNFQSSIMKEKTLKQGHVGVYHLAEIFSVEALKFKKLPHTLSLTVWRCRVPFWNRHHWSLGPPSNIAQHHPTLGPSASWIYENILIKATCSFLLYFFFLRKVENLCHVRLICLLLTLLCRDLVTNLAESQSGAPNVNFRKMSVWKAIWDLEFSEHLL